MAIKHLGVHAQGLYPDRWAADRLRWMLPDEARYEETFSRLSLGIATLAVECQAARHTGDSLAAAAQAMDLNSYRAKHGRAVLSMDSSLSALAYSHALDLARYGKTIHRSRRCSRTPRLEDEERTAGPR